MKKRLAAIGMMVCMTAAAAFSAFADDAVTIKLGHNSNADSAFNKGCEKFAELASEYSDGTLTIEIHNSGTLGDEAEMLEGVRMGTIDMCLTNCSQLAGYASEFKVLSLPYLFKDWDHVLAFLNDEEIMDILAQDALDKGVVIMQPFWADGFRHFVNNKKEVKSPEDMQGLKLRTPAYEGLIAATEAFGAAAVSMPFGEAFSAVASGTVDGMEGNSWSLIANDIPSVCKYLTRDSHMYSSCVLSINPSLYNDKLSDAQREALTKAAAEAGMWQTDLIKNNEEAEFEELAELGMTVTEVDMDEWIEAAQPVYEQFAEDYDMDLVAKIQALAE